MVTAIVAAHLRVNKKCRIWLESVKNDTLLSGYTTADANGLTGPEMIMLDVTQSERKDRYSSAFL